MNEELQRAGAGYAIRTDGAVLLVEFASEATFNAVLDAMAVVDAPMGTHLELWDLGTPGLRLNAGEIRALAARAQEKSYRPRRTAIVARSDLTYGLCRVYAARSESTATRVRAFREPTSAREWLLIE